MINAMNALARLGSMLLMLLVLTACARLEAIRDPYEPPLPVMPEVAPATSGAIYREGGAARLFEDLRAARVGDILT
ncbi:MAG: hypothetical protein WBN23_12405, partial [Woeseia sp.]